MRGIVSLSMSVVLSVLFLPVAVAFAGKTARLKENVSYLKELIRAEPWAYATIKEIIRLDADFYLLSKQQEEGWQEKLRVIEDHPNYIPDAMNSMIDLFKVVAREELVEEPMLWKVIAPDGREHYLFGTSHDLIPANFSPAALSALQTVVADVDTVMYEAGSEQRLQTIRQALDSGEAEHLELDDYIISLAMQGDKKLSQLEGVWELMLESFRQEEAVEAINEQDNAEVEQMSEDETIHYIVVDQLEPTFISHRAYVRRDVRTLQSLFSTDKFLTVSKSWAVEQRNHNWLPRILANCEESSCLIAAGVRHMLPDSESFSLISLLRQQGFEVEVFDVSLPAR